MERKIRIGVLLPSLRGGGAERVIVNIVNHINKSKFDVYLIVFNKVGPYINEVNPKVKVIDLESERIRKGFLKLWTVLKELKLDIVFSTMNHVNLALLLISKFPLMKFKTVIREANTPSKSLTKHSWIKGKIELLLGRLLYPTSAMLISQCDEMKEDILHVYKMNGKKVVTIYNPLDIKNIKNRIGRKSPYQSEKRNVIAIGRLTYQKGFDVLLEAFSGVVKIVPNAYLTILGEGELKEDLKDQIKKLNLTDHVDLKGFQPNPYTYLYHSDIFVLSSRWEGFPNTVLEALACNVKVVSTDCKSGPKEILGDNKYGYLVKSEDSKSLEQGILMALNERTIRSDRAYDFDVDKIVSQYEHIFMKVLK